MGRRVRGVMRDKELVALAAKVRRMCKRHNLELLVGHCHGHILGHRISIRVLTPHGYQFSGTRTDWIVPEEHDNRKEAWRDTLEQLREALPVEPYGG